MSWLWEFQARRLSRHPTFHMFVQLPAYPHRLWVEKARSAITDFIIQLSDLDNVPRSLFRIYSLT